MERLAVVKLETSEPGLYGLGCATEGFRPLAVATAIEKYLKPFVVGKDADQALILAIDDASSLWRGGPVLNDALSGIDMASGILRANGPTCRFSSCWAEDAALPCAAMRMQLDVILPSAPRW